MPLSELELDLQVIRQALPRAEELFVSHPGVKEVVIQYKSIKVTVGPPPSRPPRVGAVPGDMLEHAGACETTPLETTVSPTVSPTAHPEQEPE